MKLNGNANIAVGIGATIYTDSFRFGDVDTFALSYIVSCTGIPNIRIQMEQSQVGPVTEGAADVNFAVPKTIPDVETSLTSKLIQHYPLTPLCLSYIRFKITELSNTVTDTVVNMSLSLQKKFRM
jgi:hypothetical protein